MTEIDPEYMATMQDDLIKLMDSWCRQNANINPAVLGAVLMSTALKVYRTSMSNEDFNRVVDMISNSRDNVLPFGLIDKSQLN